MVVYSDIKHAFYLKTKQNKTNKQKQKSNKTKQKQKTKPNQKKSFRNIRLKRGEQPNKFLPLSIIARVIEKQGLNYRDILRSKLGIKNLSKLYKQPSEQPPNPLGRNRQYYY